MRIVLQHYNLSISAYKTATYLSISAYKTATYIFTMVRPSFRVTSAAPSVAIRSLIDATTIMSVE